MSPEPELLALFDRDERLAATFPDLRRENSDRLVRHTAVRGHSGVVLHSSLSAETADAAIAAQVAYFSGLGQDFEWKVYTYDPPGDLVDRLAARGFEIDQPEAVMVDGVTDLLDELAFELENHPPGTGCTWHG